MSALPIRIQRRRTAGWRMPAETTSVARPGRWGNPYLVELRTTVPSGDTDDDGNPVMMGPWLCRHVCDNPETGGWWYDTRAEAHQKAADLYRLKIVHSHDPHWTALRNDLLDSLRWRNIACWCPLDMPCHGDVLLELANRRIKP